MRILDYTDAAGDKEEEKGAGMPRVTQKGKGKGAITSRERLDATLRVIPARTYTLADLDNPHSLARAKAALRAFVNVLCEGVDPRQVCDALLPPPDASLLLANAAELATRGHPELQRPMLTWAKWVGAVGGMV
jgi:hypothetical protein